MKAFHLAQGILNKQIDGVHLTIFVAPHVNYNNHTLHKFNKAFELGKVERCIIVHLPLPGIKYVKR